MDKPRIGIIGGTGLGEALSQRGGETVRIDTPFGRPSSDPIVGALGDTTVAFIARHGTGHRFNPSNVPYRANVWALKQLGVSAILASGATGSLRESIKPGHLVICDQVIDKTFRRAGTFFDEGVVAHVELAEPFCPRLRSLLAAAAEHAFGDSEIEVHIGGTYVCMEGPQFSTRAESLMHQSWGGDLIGMTCMPEAKLAREAELCYAMVALVTDYDCWRPHTGGTADSVLATVIANLERATASAMTLLTEGVGRMTDAGDACGCGRALDLAVWTERSALEALDGANRERLESLLARYLRRRDGGTE